MFIANELRKRNIVEYLLYMWQIEDTIRVFDCSLPRIRREYISKFEYSEEQKEEEADWFGNLVRMMNEEGCREVGHLQINKVTLQLITDLHLQLVRTAKFPLYNTTYYKVLPYIVELRRKSDGTKMPEIETCLNMLYGVMLLRLQKKELTPNTEHAVQEVSKFIGMLADFYKRDKEEPLFDE